MMENVIIQDAPIIKDVKIKDAVLKEFKSSEESLITSLLSFDAEISKMEESLIPLENEIFKLEADKKGIEELILDGNSSLAVQVLPLKTSIELKQKEIASIRENIQYIEGLKIQQIETLEKGLYSKFIDSNSLLDEYSSNADNLQLKLYSLAYQAFEVEQQLLNLSTEYRNAVEGKFDTYKPYKSFTEYFNSYGYITTVRNNFQNVGTHFNGFSYDRIIPFKEALEGFKGNKELMIYK